MNTPKLIEVLEAHDFDVGLAEGGTELVISCPLCFSEDKKLYISADTGAFLCFKCDTRGGLRRLLLDICEMPPNEAYPTEMALLTGKRQVPGLLVQRPAPPAIIDLPQGFTPIGPNMRTTYDGSAVGYLESRGVGLRLAAELGIGFCLGGYYKYRVIIPVQTQHVLRTFVARSWLHDAKKKVLMPPGSQAERALFGYDGLFAYKHHQDKDIILVEGVFDAIHMWGVGYGHTLATLGAHITELQRNLVGQLKPRHVTLLRDGDEAGQEAAIKEGKALSEAMFSVKIAYLPENIDPGGATDDEIHAAIEQAKNVDQQLGVEAMKEAHQG